LVLGGRDGVPREPGAMLASPLAVTGQAGVRAAATGKPLQDPPPPPHDRRGVVAQSPELPPWWQAQHVWRAPLVAECARWRQE
jgi:hypothetical protein